MGLATHLLLHFTLSILGGWFVFRKYSHAWLAFGSAVAAGVLVDFDHFIDYLLAFGWHFRLDYFVHGYQFLQSDRIYIFFHGIEYVLAFLLLGLMVKSEVKKVIFLGLMVGLSLHIGADVAINQIPVRSYSVLYRLTHGFAVQALVTPEHFRQHLEEKKATIFQ